MNVYSSKFFLWRQKNLEPSEDDKIYWNLIFVISFPRIAGRAGGPSGEDGGVESRGGRRGASEGDTAEDWGQEGSRTAEEVSFLLKYLVCKAKTFTTVWAYELELTMNKFEIIKLCQYRINWNCDTRISGRVTWRIWETNWRLRTNELSRLS